MKRRYFLALKKTATAVAVSALLALSYTSAYATDTSDSDAAKNADEWHAQAIRAPHSIFTGTEYNKDQWKVIMSQMATYGPMSYSQAQHAAGFLEQVAPKSNGSWWDKNVVLGLAPSLDVNRDGTEIGIAPQVFALITPRLLFQAELNSAYSFTDDKFTFEGAEYANFTYFPKWERVSFSVGKVQPDFNMSLVRLDMQWINPWQDHPWAAQIGPESTIGGQVRFNVPLSENLQLNGSVFGGVGGWRYFEADRLVGGRLGVFMPKSNFEMGVSAEQMLIDNQTVLGAYAIKSFPEQNLRLQGEVAGTKTQQTAWLGATWSPLTSGWGKDITFVSRIQGLHVKKVQEEDAMASTTDEETVVLPTDEEAVIAPADEARTLTSTRVPFGELPESSASNLYLGINYQLPSLGNGRVKSLVKIGGTIPLSGPDTGGPMASVVFKY